MLKTDTSFTKTDFNIIPKLYPVTINDNQHPQLPKTWPETSSTCISAQNSEISIKFIYFCKAFYTNYSQNISIWIYTNMNYTIFINNKKVISFIQSPATLVENNIIPIGFIINKGWNSIIIEVDKLQINVGMFIVIYDIYTKILLQGDKSWEYALIRDILGNINFLLTPSQREQYIQDELPKARNWVGPANGKISDPSKIVLPTLYSVIINNNRPPPLPKTLPLAYTI